MSTTKKTLSVLLIGLLVANISLLALKKIEILFFWLVIIVIAGLAYFALPKIK